MLIIFMHQHKNMLINGKRKKIKTEYLLHECALLVKEYFRNKELYSLLWGLKYFTCKKEVPKAKASKTSLM